MTKRQAQILVEDFLDVHKAPDNVWKAYDFLRGEWE